MRGPGSEAYSSQPDLIRIGDKVVQLSRIHRLVERILVRRAEGLSQQQVAEELGVDRTLVSRLETLGEVRRGPKIALIGFPIANRDELQELAQRQGVDFVLLMSNQERWQFVEGIDGASLFNQVLTILGRIKDCDVVIFLGSDLRVRTVEELIGRDRLLAKVLGPSPLETDCYVDRAHVEALIDAACQKGRPR